MRGWGGIERTKKRKKLREGGRAWKKKEGKKDGRQEGRKKTVHLERQWGGNFHRNGLGNLHHLPEGLALRIEGRKEGEKEGM
jgi:hypothetical protein